MPAALSGLREMESTTRPTACPTTHPPPLVLFPPLFEVWLRAGSTGSIPPHTALGVCCNTRMALCLPTHSPQLEPPYPRCWAGDDDVGRAQSRLPRAMQGAGSLTPALPFLSGRGICAGAGGLCWMHPAGLYYSSSCREVVWLADQPLNHSTPPTGGVTRGQG